jgi:hypothetical protein
LLKKNVRMQEHLKQAELQRHKLCVVEQLPEHLQRLWAVSVPSVSSVRMGSLVQSTLFEWGVERDAAFNGVPPNRVATSSCTDDNRASSSSALDHHLSRLEVLVDLDLCLPGEVDEVLHLLELAKTQNSVENPCITTPPDSI